MCESVKKVSVSALYILNHVKNECVRNTFIIAQILRVCEMKKYLRGRHRGKKKVIPGDRDCTYYSLPTLVCDTFDDARVAYIIQFYRLLNYNVDNLIEWRLRVTLYDIAINNMCTFP